MGNRSLRSQWTPARLKRELDLPALVSRVTDLREVGPDRYSATCPFHEDRSPSFSVWRDSDTAAWMSGCWACKPFDDGTWAFGDVFDFIQATDGVSKAGALERARELADDPRLARTPPAERSGGEADLSTECAGLARGGQADRLVSRFLTEKGMDWVDAEWLRTEFRLGATKGGDLAIPNWSGGRCCSIKLRDPAAGWSWSSFRGSRHEELYGWWRDGGQLPLVVCEGESDTWAVASWFPADRVTPVGLPGAAKRPTRRWVEQLDGREVCIMLDADIAGEGGSQTWLQALPRAQVVTLPPGTDARSAGRPEVASALSRARGRAGW